MELASSENSKSVEKVDLANNKDDGVEENQSTSDATVSNDVPNKILNSTDQADDNKNEESLVEENSMDVTEVEEFNTTEETNNSSDVTPMEVDQEEPVKDANELQSDKENSSTLGQEIGKETVEDVSSDKQKDISENQNQSSDKDINESTEESGLLICETKESNENTDKSIVVNESIDKESLDISKENSNDIECCNKDQNAENQQNCDTQVTEKDSLKELSQEESAEQTIECNDVEMGSESEKDLGSEKNQEIEKTEFVQINQEKDDSQLDNQSEAVDPFGGDSLSNQIDSVEESMEVDSGGTEKSPKPVEKDVRSKEIQNLEEKEKDTSCTNEEEESEVITEKQTTENITKEATKEVTEDDIEKETEKETETEKSTEEATEKLTEDATEKVTEDGTEKVTEDATEKVTEDATEKESIKSTKEAVEEAAKETTKEVTEKAPVEVMETTADKSMEDIIEITDKVTEEVMEIIEKIAVESAEKPTEKSSETLLQKNTEKDSDESTAIILPGQDDELCIIPDTTKDKSKEKSSDISTAEKKKEDDILIEGEFPKTSEIAKSSEVSNKDSEPNKKTSDTAGLKIAALTADPGGIQVNLEKSPDAPAIVSDIIDIDDDAKNSEVEEISAKDVCKQCSKEKPCSIKVRVGTKSYIVCSDECKIAFANDNNKSTDIPSEGVNSKREKRCANCLLIVESKDERNLSWETMEFCNEECLGKFQTKYGSYCRNCNGAVQPVSLGKYCVRFGYDVRQFCCSTCLEEFKKGLKVCSYCQKDISAGTEGFLAPVGDKGQFKDFCTQDCMEKYSKMNSTEPPTPEKKVCGVCQEEKVMHCEVQIERNPAVAICSEPCFAAFKFVNKVDPDQCSTCKKYFQLPTKKGFIVFYEDEAHTFCNKTCLNVFIITNRKIVPCNWCKVKKYNFDMIKKELKSGQVMMMCSLNCLTLYQVSINAVSARRILCDFCKEYSQAQYHLTMSDATIRNFCSYKCVMNFQSQYTKSPITIPTGEVAPSDPVPTGIPKRVIQPPPHPRASGSDLVPLAPKKTMPIISSVASLAQMANGQAPNTVQLSNAQTSIGTSVQPITLQNASPVIYKQQVVTRPTSPVEVGNKMTQCRPLTHTKGVSVRPVRNDQSTQTDAPEKVFIPVPVPICIPVPVHMYHMPFPVPVPIPIPIPVPIFIPTTRNSTKGIFKELKRIQEKIPSDPFEAELLMMAEMAEIETEKKNESDSDSNDDARDDGEVNDGAPADSYSPEAVDSTNAFGEDMLQIALKMATGELEEPAVDLDTALTPSTIQTPQRPQIEEVTENNVQPERVHTGRGRKRGSSYKPRGMPSKRGRRSAGSNDVALLPTTNNQISISARLSECGERPDANMALKYTYGVNAWRQWVITKNAELEKQSTPTRKLKLFKTDLLQLTADELNYSLCLFVKELRKPNGAEYEPDTIYYLSLGIQQYLFENNRIDNIFTDAYYEKFTDCLNEIAKKFASLYDNAPRIITRVEEEHLWECKQLGAHSPHVLLNTLMYFNTKHFNLTTVEEHMQLSFSHIMKHWKRNPTVPGGGKVSGSRNVLLRFYPPQSTLESNSKKKKVYEQQENENDILRCPVKLYEFYLSKCPESVKTRNDVFYLLPERSCVPDSPVWYSTSPLAKEHLVKMLYRIKMVKEINVALLSS